MTLQPALCQIAGSLAPTLQALGRRLRLQMQPCHLSRGHVSIALECLHKRALGRSGCGTACSRKGIICDFKLSSPCKKYGCTTQSHLAALGARHKPMMPALDESSGSSNATLAAQGMDAQENAAAPLQSDPTDGTGIAAAKSWLPATRRHQPAAIPSTSRSLAPSPPPLPPQPSLLPDHRAKPSPPPDDSPAPSMPHFSPSQSPSGSWSSQPFPHSTGGSVPPTSSASGKFPALRGGPPPLPPGRLHPAVPSERTKEAASPTSEHQLLRLIVHTLLSPKPCTSQHIV